MTMSIPKPTTNNPSFQCGVCDKTYDVRGSYRKHLRHIHNTCLPEAIPVPYPPPTSKKKTKSTQALSDTSLGNLYCSPCDKTFNLRVSYRKHLNLIHNICIRPRTTKPITSSSSFQCILCEKKYDFRESYRKHLKRTHDISLASLTLKNVAAVNPQVLPDISAGNLHCARATRRLISETLIAGT